MTIELSPTSFGKKQNFWLDRARLGVHIVAASKKSMTLATIQDFNTPQIETKNGYLKRRVNTAQTRNKKITPLTERERAKLFPLI